MTATPGTQPGPKLTGGLAERAWTLMQRFVDAHSRHDDLAHALGFRLGAGRGRILFQLRDGPLTLSELAEANGYDAPYTTLVVDKLESHGLVKRQAHPDDRRRKLVTLTDTGQAAIITADGILRRPPSSVSSLPPEELEQLAELLQHVIDLDVQNDT